MTRVRVPPRSPRRARRVRNSGAVASQRRGPAARDPPDGPAGQGRRRLVPPGRVLRGAHPRVLRLQRRRHRRPDRPAGQARLPRMAGRRLPVAAAVLPVAHARRRLRHQRLLHRPPRARVPRRPGGLPRRRPPTGHPGDRRPRHEPHERSASVVRRVAVVARQPQGRLVRLERRRPALARGARRLRRRGDVQLDMGPSARQQYYWHRFYSHQPDLNYENPDVVEAMFGVVRFWLDLGLDGFRLDAVPYLFQRDGTTGENLPETHALLRQLRKEVDAAHPNRVHAGRSQPVARRPRRLLRRRRRVPHVLPLPAHAAPVHGGPARAALPRHRDPGPDPGDPRQAANGPSSCATTTSSPSRR